DPDGNDLPADVRRYRHRLDFRRGDVPRAGARGLFRVLDRQARLSPRNGADADDHHAVLHLLPRIRRALCPAQSAHPDRWEAEMTELSTGAVGLAKPDRVKQHSPLYYAWRR